MQSKSTALCLANLWAIVGTLLLCPVVARADDAPPPPDDPLLLRFGVTGALALRLNAPPLTAANLAVDAGLRWRFLSGALEFRFTFPQQTEPDPYGRELGQVMQFATGGVPCVHASPVFLGSRLPGCEKLR